MKNLRYYLRVTLSLLVICTVVALLLSAVNGLTRERIEKQAKAEQEAAIVALFPSFAAAEETTGNYTDGVNTVHLVKGTEEVTLGYAVNLTVKGYGGDMTMTVGLDAAGAVVGVKILSHSETPGLGSRATLADYLLGYVGLDHPPVLGEDIDAVTGATISSRAVKNGVALALSLGLGGETA